MTVRQLRLSPLPKTWIVDLDGVLLRHNGHLRGEDEILAGVADFAAQIGPDDLVVVMTARHEREREASLALLRDAGLHVDIALFGVPVGERVLINDAKPSGLRTAYAVNLSRDEGLPGIRIEIDDSL
ncbi:hypothetical protein ACQP2C_12015 [Micromonospora zamorensis]|uniref:hypothetical protein n=1 Tax=Micromonospora zamorensis TaxID=709883 RepID=UPI003D95F545